MDRNQSINSPKKETDFNIYYLNFSKVYEMSMMINNVIVLGIAWMHQIWRQDG